MASIVAKLNAALIHAVLTTALHMACNRPMTVTHPDKAIIDALGGPTAVAQRLHFGRGGVQRVHNWTVRGIPAAVRLQHLDLFGKPEDSVNGRACSQAA